MSKDRFNKLFQRATDVQLPYSYRRDLVMVGDTISQLFNVPVGLGMTAAVLAWFWRRLADESLYEQTPRRLIYCLLTWLPQLKWGVASTNVSLRAVSP